MWTAKRLQGVHHVQVDPIQVRVLYLGNEIRKASLVFSGLPNTYRVKKTPEDKHDESDESNKMRHSTPNQNIQLPAPRHHQETPR